MTFDSVADRACPTPPHLRAIPGGRAAAPSVDDEAVLAAWDSGDPGFGTLLYDHLAPSIRRTVYRVLGQAGHDHEDVAQASFEKLLVSLARGTFERGCSLRSWATMIASRTALNAIRSRQTQRRYFAAADAATEEPSGDGPARAHSRLLLQEVRSELSRMSLRRTDALVLHDVLGHELTEIAAMLGISVSAAQSRVVRGRQELHGRLQVRGLLSGPPGGGS